MVDILFGILAIGIVLLLGLGAIAIAGELEDIIKENENKEDKE